MRSAGPKSKARAITRFDGIARRNVPKRFLRRSESCPLSHSRVPKAEQLSTASAAETGLNSSGSRDLVVARGLRLRDLHDGQPLP